MRYLTTCIVCLFVTQASAGSLYAPLGLDSDAPAGWPSFCARYPSDCIARENQRHMVELTNHRWRELLRINASVNRFVTLIEDSIQYNKLEWWEYATHGQGDCEDVALLKKKTLIQRGWPEAALLMTVVREARGGHAVLTVVTDKGEFILDNMNDEVLPWAKVPYRFIARQSQRDPNRWVKILAPLTTATVR